MPKRPHRPRPAEIQPLDVDGVRAVAIGTVLWTIGFVGLLPFRERLELAGYGWWPWTCLAGAGLGLLGLEFCRKRRDAIKRRRAAGPGSTPAQS